MAQLEDYLKGRPLTPELAALARGEDVTEMSPGPGSAQVAPPPPGAITDDDREWLRKLRTHPGWQIYLQLLDSTVEKAQQEAVAFSQIDPVSNGAEIARVWTYLKSWREIRRLTERLLDVEIAQLPAEQKGITK